MVVRGRTRNAIGPQGRVGSTPTISAMKAFRSLNGTFFILLPPAVALLTVAQEEGCSRLTPVHHIRCQRKAVFDVLPADGIHQFLLCIQNDLFDPFCRRSPFVAFEIDRIDRNSRPCNPAVPGDLPQMSIPLTQSHFVRN